jgi:cytochrome c peroxidase
VFAKLLELGINRDAQGKIVDDDGNGKHQYESASRKMCTPGAPEKSTTNGQIMGEALPLKEINKSHMGRL